MNSAENNGPEFCNKLMFLVQTEIMFFCFEAERSSSSDLMVPDSITDQSASAR